MQIYEIISKTIQTPQNISHGFSITLHPKFAQIWNVEIPEEEAGIIVGNFSESLRRMYELEYKYSMLKKRPFKGVEHRHFNMVSRLESELIAELDDIKSMLLESLEKWLDSHAITNPEQWADARVRDNEERGDGHFEELIYEYNRYIKKLPATSRARALDTPPKMFYTLLSRAIGNPSFPVLNQTLERYYLPCYKEMLLDELRDVGELEEFQERYDFAQQYASQEEVENAIDDLSIEDVDIADIIYFGDIDEFEIFLENSGVLEDVAKEFYQYYVFPVWYGNWKAKGVDETRKSVEIIYANLQKANVSNVEEYAGAVNAALNAAHQTGAMTDYYERDVGEDISDVLKHLSEMDTSQWDKDLRTVGCQI